MGYIPLLVKLDLIQPIDVSRVPNLEKVMPIFRNDPNINVDGKLYGVPFTWGGGPMVYDPAVITTPPESWKDLLKPEFTGKVGMMDDPLGNMMIGALVATGTETPTKINAEQLEKTIDFLIEVKKQSRVVAASWGDLSDAIARGDVAVTFNGWETMVKFCGDKGKVVKYTYPKERTNAWLDNYCIAKDAPNLDAAYELCNRVISVEGQKRLAEVAIQAIVNSDAVAALPPEIRALYPYDDIADYGKKAGFFGFPPTEPEGDLHHLQRLAEGVRALQGGAYTTSRESGSGPELPIRPDIRADGKQITPIGWSRRRRWSSCALFIAPMAFFVLLSFWQVEYFELSTEPTIAELCAMSSPTTGTS